MQIKELPAEYYEILIESIDANPKNNTREDVGDLTGLKDSIKNNGLQSPILVRPNNDGTYRLVSGFRRVGACKELELKKIPARFIAKNSSAQTMLDMNLTENLQRKNLTPIEEAKGFKRAMEFGSSVNKISMNFGVRDGHVQSRLQLLKMSEHLQNAVHNDIIAISAAKEINRLPLKLHEKGIEIASGASATQVRKFVDLQLKRKNGQEDIIQKGQAEDSGEGDAACVVRKCVKDDLMLIARVFCPDAMDEIGSLMFNGVPTPFLRLLKNIFSFVPKSAQKMDEIREAVEKREKSIEILKEELPSEPEFWGGPTKAPAKVFTHFLECYKDQYDTTDEHIIEAKARLVEIAFDRIGGASAPKITQRDVLTLAGKMNVRLCPERRVSTKPKIQLVNLLDRSL